MALHIDVLNFLLSHRASVASVPDRSAPGVYGIFAKGRESLPGIELASNCLIYVGLSSDLAQRNHFKAKHSGFHSPRRTLGAILQAPLRLKAIPRGPGASPTNCRNFRFTEDGEVRLTHWMAENLEYAIYPYRGDLALLETQLIRELEPPLNLTSWPNPQMPKIVALRTGCRDEAKRHMLRSE